MNFGSNYRRTRWYAALTVGLVGFAGMAALSGMHTVVPVAEKSVSPPQRAATTKTGDGGEQRKEINVGCDSDELIAALVRANADGGGTLILSEVCTYTLTAHTGGNGLPVIVGSIAVEGNGATIVRAANAEKFRIFNVGLGGNLQLRDLTIKGGFADAPLGGGGLLVRTGGKATVEHVVFTFNQSDGAGGALANYGITRIASSHKPNKDDGGKDADGAKDGEGGSGLTDDGISRTWVEDSWTEDDWAKGEDGENANVTLVTHNSAYGSGGGIFNTGALSVSNTRISYNNALGDAGGLSNFGGTAELTDTSVDHNHAVDDGGGISAAPNLMDKEATTTLKRTLVAGNFANDAAGGINNEGSDVYVLHSIVRGNNSTQSGGGIVNADGKVTVDDSKIDRNTAGGDGGGVFSSGQFVIRRSEVNLNSAVGVDSHTGGIRNSSGRLRLSKTRVIANFASVEPGGVSTTNDQVTVDDESPIVKNRPTNCEGSPIEVPNCFG
jgi:hypothetical protein